MPRERVNALADELIVLLQDSDVRGRALPPASFWSIVHYGEGSYENRYNRVVRWLLDPTENHGLGAAVANALIANAGDTDVEVGTRRVRSHVETPVPGMTTGAGPLLKGRIDVSLLDHANKIVITVESKLSSSAHDEQLARYRAHVEAERRGWRQYFVFLTELDERADDEGWGELTYAEFADLLREILDRQEVSAAVSTLIQDFIADIARRAQGPSDAKVAALYFDDHDQPQPTHNRFADLLVSVASQIEPDEQKRAGSKIERLGAYLGTRGVSVDALPSEQIFDLLWTKLAAAFGPSFSASDLTRLLSYVLDHAPQARTQDQSIKPGVRDFFARYFTLLTGAEVPRDRGSVPVLTEHSADGYLRSVQLNRGGRGLTFNVGDARPFRISGPDPDSFPWWVAHIDPGTNRQCAIIGRKITKRPLAEWHERDLHDAIVAGLGADEVCACGAAIVRVG